MPTLPDSLSSILIVIGLIAAGYGLGIVGNVGGPLFVVLLLSVGHLHTTTAIGTALFISCLISLFALAGHWRQGNIDRTYALPAGLGGAVGCLAGALVAQRVPVGVLEPMLGLVVLIIPSIGLARLARRLWRPAAGATPAPAPKLPRARPELVGGAIGTVVGSFCGAFGLGGATPIAALSRMLLNQPMRFSIGSAYVAALFISLIGSAFYGARGQIDFGYSLLISAACGLGVFLSTRAVSRIPNHILEALMLVTMAAMALSVLIGNWRDT